MCVLIYKPKGTAMPPRAIFDKINRCNHDGYGLAATRHSFKTMYYGKFLQHLAAVGRDEDCIVHFRLATHGSKCRRNCHPFELGGVYFAHNGVLGIEPQNDMTDSETAFRRHIYPAVARYGFGSEQADGAIYSMLGCSRFAMMCRGQVRLYGQFHELGGVYYSNLRWLY